jgi:dimethylaniline monooxygenase (N-oxide forming)
MPHWVPWKINSWLTRLIVASQVGNPWNFGLPKPDHRILQAHPTISQEIFIRLGSGDIHPYPGVRRLTGSGVEFVDGREEPVDLIVWCTGYKVSFPFFDPSFIAAEGNDLPLWERMIKPGVDNLFFVGLLQPLGAIMPVAEAQARLIGDVLAGRVALPAADKMRLAMEEERRALFSRYKDRAPRHTMQVDFGSYLWRLRRARKKGAAAAKKQGYRLPIAPRAASQKAEPVSRRTAS